MTQGVYNEPKISTYPSYIASQTPAFDILCSLFPRRSLPVVLQATVGGRKEPWPEIGVHFRFNNLNGT